MSRESRADAAESAPEASKGPPRRSSFEEKLRRAIRHKQLVTLRYAGDPADHTFAPHGIYVSPEGAYCVAGLQLADSAGPRERAKPEHFEIAKIAALRLTDVSFAPDARFDPRDDEYRHGIVQWIRSA